MNLSATTYIVWSEDGAESCPDTWERVVWWLKRLLTDTPRLRYRRVWVEAMPRQQGASQVRTVFDSTADDLPEPEYGACARCPRTGEVWRVNGEWLCESCKESA